MAEKIVIDAGHDGIGDPGAVYNGRRESDDNLDMALAVGDILSRNGYDVEYTRTGNTNQTVQQKAQFANDGNADLFISIHRNSSPYPGQYNGVQTLIYDRSGIIASLTTMIAGMNIPLLAISARTTRNKTTVINLTLEVKDKEQLSQVMKQFQKNPDIIEAYRSST